MPFSTRRILILDGRQDPTRRPIFLLGNYPRPPSCYRGSDRGLTLYLAYVVEGHASACPQTVGVATLCGVVMRTLRGRRGWVAMVTVNKGKVKLPKGYKYVLYHLFVLFVGKKNKNCHENHRFLSNTESKC